MLKKILSLTLCLCICLGVVFSATSCSSGDSETSTSSTDAVPTTLSFLGVTSEVTDQDNVQMVEDALNDIFSARFKTKIDLTLVTEDKYMALIEERIEEAKYWQNYDNSILQYNAYIKKQANQTGTTADKIFGNWISGGVEISLETLATRLVFLSEETTVHEDGRVETLYPDATPIDIVMILDEAMYDEFDNIGLLVDQIDPNSASLKTLQKYIYPTFFTELKALKGSVNAIPNNNLLAESTYLVVNKKLADKYNYDITAFKNYSDTNFQVFLANVKANESVVTFKNIPEALGIFKLFSEDVAVGTYIDPLIGYDPESTDYDDFEIKNLFEIPQYVDHLALMETYQKSGYFNQENWANGYAVQVIEGDASVMEKYSAEDSEYYVKEIQIPFVLREAIFDGMLAYTSYCDEPERALEIIEAINTDSEIKNILQYGIPEYNYIENTNNGTVIRLNSAYMMENAYTGNVYMGLLEEDMKDTSWAYVKQSNLASASSPFLLFPVDEEYLQDNLEDILQDAALAQALDKIGISFDKYSKAEGSELVSLNNMLKNGYKTFFLQALVDGGKAADLASAEEVFKGGGVTISFYEEAIANKIIAEKYNKIQTFESIGELVDTKLAEAAVNDAELYWKAKDNAAKYLENIESLRVIARITLFNDLSDADYQKQYGSLSISALETAVYNYIRENFIRENNLTDEDYATLVEDFIAKELTFTNQSTKVQYSYTWKDYEEIKEYAETFANALANAKTTYRDVLLAAGHKAEEIDSWDNVTLADNIITALRQKFYRSLNTSTGEYTSFVQSKILSKYGYTVKEFSTLKNTDNGTYKAVLAKIKKDYKKQLLETYTKEEYEALSDTKAYDAVVQYVLEEDIKAQADLCNAMGLSKAEYQELYYYAQEHIKCVNKMRTSFIYTLGAYNNLTTTEIFAWSVNDIETRVYDAVYNSGYYMNQLAQCIGISLSDYNSNKSDATKYISYVNDVIDEYSHQLKVAGYDVATVKTYSPDEVEDILRDIIREKDFSEYKTIDVVFAEMCKDSIAGVDTTYTNIRGYCETQASKLSDNYLFSALVSYLNADLQKQLEAAKPEA